jgi:hypothetical protein
MLAEALPEVIVARWFNLSPAIQGLPLDRAPHAETQSSFDNDAESELSARPHGLDHAVPAIDQTSGEQTIGA